MNHGLLDILSISHFIIYFVIGLFLKNKYLLVLLVGILFEIFEYYISTNETIKTLLIEYWFIPEIYWNDTLEHKIVDIIINMIGYYIGNKISLS